MSRQAGVLDRVMFGGDQMAWPGAIGESVAFLNGLEFLSQEEKAAILYGNAKRFLRIE